mmetsp:Transcript_571/g.933  ORF Transcript_571/g.933 Transcript_571/m.933 type:complete len:110 (-) Transcript_571:208-537(-)
MSVSNCRSIRKPEKLFFSPGAGSFSNATRRQRRKFVLTPKALVNSCHDDPTVKSSGNRKKNLEQTNVAIRKREESPRYIQDTQKSRLLPFRSALSSPPRVRRMEDTPFT